MHTIRGHLWLCIDSVGRPDRCEFRLRASQEMPESDHMVDPREVEGCRHRISFRVDTNRHHCDALGIGTQVEHGGVELLGHQWTHIGAMGIHKGEDDRFACKLRQRDRLPKLVREAKAGRGNASQIGSLQARCIGFWETRWKSPRLRVAQRDFSTITAHDALSWFAHCGYFPAQQEVS
jgi:hypothetical protein